MVGNEGEIDGKEEKSWINLFSKYYGGTHEDRNNTGKYIDTYLLSSAFSFLHSGGYWNNGDPDGRAWRGLYWLVRIESTPAVTMLDFTSTFLFYQNSASWDYGFSLRCVVHYPLKNEMSARESSEINTCYNGSMNKEEIKVWVKENKKKFAEESKKYNVQSLLEKING